MNLDPKTISEGLNKVLSAIPYPVTKNDLIDMARQRNVNPQIISALDRLPNTTFNSKDELQNSIQSLVGAGQQRGQQQR